METFVWFIVLVFVGIVVAVVVGAMNAKSKSDDLIKRMAALPSFALTESLIAPNVGIGLDPHSKQLAIALRNGENVVCDVLPYSRLTGVDLLLSEGNSTQTKKTGFATFTSGGNISAITLSVTTADERFAAVLVPLFVTCGTASLDDINRSNAFRLGNEWKVKLLSILRAPVVPQEPVIWEHAGPLKAVTFSPSVAGEIAALHQLLKDGALSEEEYSHAKATLLGGA